MGSGAFLVEACRQLDDALVEAWHAHDETPEIPPDEDEVIFARRLIAQRCLYGVDRNPVAVDLAKVSLWLVTLAKDHALTFLDHALRHGDSLVGLSRKQIEAFHWDPDAPRFQAGFETMQVRGHVAKIATLRQRIREADESVSDWELRDLWDEARVELGTVRLFGDLVLAAFFEKGKPKERERKRSEYANAVLNREAEGHRTRLEEWRHANQSLAPFHWEIEFPEVFDKEREGFDVMVGNPPFAGRTTTATSNINCYLTWLQHAHPESHGNADVVAHFFRRAFDLLGEGGALGLVTTNTIGQGDTRVTGLRWICRHGGEIFAARKRVRWPGLAAVVVSVLHLMKGPVQGQRRLDDRKVETITAFLFHSGGHDDPARLAANAGKSFQGCVVVGMGFTFDDVDSNDAPTPIAEMRRLLEKDLRRAPSTVSREVQRPHSRTTRTRSTPSAWQTGLSPRLLVEGRDAGVDRSPASCGWGHADLFSWRPTAVDSRQPSDKQSPVSLAVRGAGPPGNRRRSSRLLKNTRIGLFSWPSCVSRPPRQRCARGHAVPTRGPATPAAGDQGHLASRFRNRTK